MDGCKWLVYKGQKLALPSIETEHIISPLVHLMLPNSGYRAFLALKRKKNILLYFINLRVSLKILREYIILFDILQSR